MKAQKQQRNGVDLLKLQEVERYLEANLLPVSPRTDFVLSLKYQLLNKTEPIISLPGAGMARNMMVVIAGLLSGTLILVFGGRAFFALLASLGIIQVKKRMETKCAPPLNPAV